MESDSILKIRAEVSGTSDVAELLKKLEQGKLTLNEITQLKKGLNAAFKEVATGTKEWQLYAYALAKVNDVQRDVRITTRAGHEEYFKLGLEIRQLTLASGLLSGKAAEIGGALGSSISGAIGLKQALTPLGIAMGPVSIGITALIALLPNLVNYFRESAKEAMGLADELTRVADLRVRLEEAGKIEKIKAYQEALDLLLKKRNEADIRREQAKGGIDLLGMSDEDYKALDAKIGNLRVELKGLYDSLKMPSVGEQFVFGDPEEQRKIDEHNREFERKRIQMMLEGAKALGGPGTLPKNGGMVIGPTAAVPQTPKIQAKLTFGEMITQTKAFESAFSDATSVISQGISSQIGGAFREVFGGANSMLGQFAGQFVSTLSDILLRLAINLGLTEIGITMLPGRALGGPVSAGTPYVVGERGPEIFIPSQSGRVVSNAKSSRFPGGDVGMQPIVLDTRIRGNDLVLVQAKASRARSGRTM